MYKCQLCNSNIGPRKCHYKVVVEKREREYHNEDKVSKGWEIVKEMVVCSDCVGER